MGRSNEAIHDQTGEAQDEKESCHDGGGQQVEQDVRYQPRQAPGGPDEQWEAADFFASDDSGVFEKGGFGLFLLGGADEALAQEATEAVFVIDDGQAEEAVAEPVGMT